MVEDAVPFRSLVWVKHGRWLAFNTAVLDSLVLQHLYCHRSEVDTDYSKGSVSPHRRGPDTQPDSNGQLPDSRAAGKTGRGMAG